MYSVNRSQYSHAKRQRLSETNALISLSNINAVKKGFLLEIKANSECNINKDTNTHSWIKYDLTQINKTVDLSGGFWSVGINACIISNSLNSWKSLSTTYSNFPSSSFIKIGVKDQKNNICNV